MVKKHGGSINFIYGGSCFNYSKVFWGADLRGDGFTEAC